MNFETYRKWTEYQVTPEMNWSNIKMDHVKSICLFDTSKDEETKDAFNWKNSPPLSKHDHQQKSIKYNFLNYQLQFVKAYQNIKINEEGLNQDLQC